MSDKIEIDKAPEPVNYKVEAKYVFEGNNNSYLTLSSGRWQGGITCTVCNQTSTDLTGYDFSPFANKYHDWVVRKVDWHNRVHHPELMWVFTSAGWLQVGPLLTSSGDSLAGGLANILHN